MRKQLMLLVAPLCVVAIAATFAGATPNDPEQTRGPKLDKLHAVRPIAAMSSVLDSSVIRASEVGKRAHTQRQPSRARVLKKMPFLVTLEGYAEAADFQARVGAYVAAVAAVERDQAIAAVMAAIAANQPAPAYSGPAYSSSYPGDFLSCVRNRESGGDYHVYNQGGSGAAGAYQFLPGTWSSIAASVGRSDLVGMDPAQASPGDQDAMAQALYAQQGSAPWGGSCG
jgi:Transglycosylase-like domain